jgi:hypothetical protein
LIDSDDEDDKGGDEFFEGDVRVVCVWSACLTMKPFRAYFGNNLLSPYVYVTELFRNREDVL